MEEKTSIGKTAEAAPKKDRHVLIISAAILAVFATIFGVATSLGLGTIQITGGLNYVYGIEDTTLLQCVIIAAITALFTLATMSGLGKAMQIVADVKVYLSIAFMVFIFVFGGAVFICNLFVTDMGGYLQNFIHKSLWMENDDFVQGWTVFYWAWWIAWAPFCGQFVGVFIARISKGRTVREFILGVVLVPAVASVLWFAVFGSMGLSLADSGVLGADAVASVAASPETGLFLVLQQYPLGTIISIVMLVLICTFFITSANSGTFVLGMLSSEGSTNPPSGKKILWGIVLTSMAIGLLVAGGLKPLQTISIAAAFPFIFVMIAAMVSVVKGLASDADTPNVGDPDFVGETQD